MEPTEEEIAAVEVPPDMAERMRLFVAAIVDCRRSLDALGPVPRGRIVCMLNTLYKADVTLYRERSAAVIEALMADEPEEGGADGA